MVENFKNKFKEIKIEGKRKASSQELPELYYTEEEIKAMYMGRDSEARKASKKWIL